MLTMDRSIARLFESRARLPSAAALHQHLLQIALRCPSRLFCASPSLLLRPLPYRAALNAVSWNAAATAVSVSSARSAILPAVAIAGSLAPVPHTTLLPSV